MSQDLVTARLAEARPGVRAAVTAEVDKLALAGIDVALCDPAVRYELPDARQRAVTDAIARRVGTPGFVEWLFDPGRHPAGRAWLGVAKRAVALHTLYHVGDLDSPAQGLEPDLFDRPLLAGGTHSARQLVEAEHAPEVAARILRRYDDFLAAGALSDGADDHGLTSLDYLTGVVDSHAVRTRADCAKELVRDHFTGQADRPLRSASLGCGAAGPVFELVEELAAAGTDLAETWFVDHDPLALAVVAGQARSRDLSGRLRVRRSNFLKTPLADVVGPGGVDVVDLIGLFEHIPRSRLGYRLAANLLVGAAAAVRPGGLVVLANMVTERPQQEFFDSVWPRLQQRTITETLAVIAAAGLPASAVRVRVPRREGVYAVYAVEVPADPPRHRRWQKLLGSALMATWPTY